MFALKLRGIIAGGFRPCYSMHRFIFELCSELLPELRDRIATERAGAMRRVWFARRSGTARAFVTAVLRTTGISSRRIAGRLAKVTWLLTDARLTRADQDAGNRAL